MIDLKATNIKLQQRARNIIKTICGPLSPNSDGEIDALLEACDGSVKLAVTTILLHTPPMHGKELLKEAGGVLAIALSNFRTDQSGSNGLSRNEEGKFVLCIDVGGSKCAAVVLGTNGEEGRGEAEGCNV